MGHPNRECRCQSRGASHRALVSLRFGHISSQLGLLGKSINCQQSIYTLKYDLVEEDISADNDLGRYQDSDSSLIAVLRAGGVL
jgi:hypothetical protein